ncbi:MAG: cytochrome D1 domain-containing protein [Fimbriimonas sp.]
MNRSLLPAFAAPLLALAACTQAEAPAPKRDLPNLGGTLVVCNQKAKSAFLIRLKDGAVVRKIETGIGPHEAAVSADGKTALVTNYGDGPNKGNSLLLIDIAQGKEIKTISLGDYTRPHGAAFVGNDRAVVTSESTKNLILVDLKEGKVLRAMPTEAEGSHMLALTPDGKTVYSANMMSGSVTKFDVATGEKRGEAKVGPRSEGIAVSPDGKWVLTGNQGDGTVSLVDTATMKVTKTAPAEGAPYRAAFSPDGKFVYVPNPAKGVLHVYEVAKMDAGKTIELGKGKAEVKLLGGPPHPMGTGIFIHPKGKYAFMSVLNGNCVAIVDLESRETVGTVPADASPDGVAWSPVEVKE